MKLALLFCLLTAAVPLGAQLPPGIVNTQDPGDRPPSPREALARITVPEGFRVTLFAGEPDVAQPIAINYDDRGRLWVAESFSYIEWGRKGRDRILIFEDTDHDGRFDQRRVFWDRGDHVSGFQLGFGGVWVCDAPNLLFIPDADRDDVPDAEPRVVLDGWTTKAEHNFFNGLTWGPDGWLYGRHGIKQPSRVGRPGTPEAERVALSCAIWRYQPVDGRFEIVADGTINPWGLDWNEEGQAFMHTSVIDHFWHVVPGARFERWPGRGTAALNPHAYELMGPTSDHRHWYGGQTERRQEGVHDETGGGHSHCGLVIYQSTAWPERYRGRAFMGNILGRRINMDHLARRGSGYVASHGEDFLLGHSDWFRPVDLKQGPAGELMVAEWTDLGECHDRDGIHRTSGRLYRVQFGEPSPIGRVDVAARSTAGLLELLRHENVWWRRRALRNLHERAAAGERLNEGQVAALREIARTGSVRDAVSAVQALHAFLPGGDWMAPLFVANTGARREAVRAQIIGLAFTTREAAPGQVAWLAARIGEEESALVRLWMTAALARIPVEQRWPGAEAMADHAEDYSDRNLDCMRWYALEPLVASDPARAVRVAVRSRQELLIRSVARRAVAADALPVVLRTLATEPDARVVAPLLAGLLAALPSRVDLPDEWPGVSAALRTHEDPGIRHAAFRLAQRFGDPEAEREMVARVLDQQSAPGERVELLRLLVAARAPGIAPHVPGLWADEVLGAEAIRAVAVFPQADSARRLLDLLRDAELPTDERTAVLETLATRRDFADALVSAFLGGEIRRAEISAYVARQIVTVAGRGGAFAERWGMSTADARERTALIARWKKRLPPTVLAEADPVAGREVFRRLCGVCHRLHGEGGVIGPDLTGSNRANLDYFLINVLFPGEDVDAAYRLVTLTLRDGRTLSGNIAAEDGGVVQFRELGRESRIDVADIVERKVSEQSMMPAGLLDALNRDDVRDLIGYLRAPGPAD